MSRLLLLGLLVATALGLSCERICAPLCTSLPCMQACSAACSEVPYTPRRRNAEFKITKLFELPPGEKITGGDAPSYPPNADYYFTTLSGKVYLYVSESRQPLQLLYQVPALDVSEGKGLYSIAVDRDYGRNNKLYLFYARPLGSGDKTEHLIQNQNNPNLYTRLGVDHLSVVEEFIRPVHELIPTQILKKLEQYDNRSAGNWLGAFAPEFGSSGYGNRLMFATGGNPLEDRLLAMFGSHLSSLRYIIPDRKDVPERVWASSIQTPLVCSTPNTRVGIARCIVEMHGTDGYVNGTGLYRFKEGGNYGSKDFIEFCGIGLPCQPRYESILNREAILTFPNTSCPVRWVHVYSGWELRKYYGRVLLTQDSCYDARTRQFTEAQILYVDYNAGRVDSWSTTPLSLELDFRYLVDTKLLGADSHNTLMLSGISLKTGNTVVQRVKINPSKYRLFR